MNQKNRELATIVEKLIAFRDARDWKQFHNPKDIALSISLEAAELLELFQWKSPEEAQRYAQQKTKELRDELADIVNWALVLAHDCGIDILQECDRKIDQNAVKYPVDKSWGKSTKYTQL